MSINKKIKHNIRITNLRGLSVILIFFYHLDYLLPGGYIGVDIFFVVSGYLIYKITSSSTFLSKKELKLYFIKRFNRLTPVLIFVSIITIYLSYLFIIPEEAKYLRDSLQSIIFYYSNIFYIETTNYFNTNAFNPLIHTWSLAVEFQFYLFIVLFLFLIKFLKVRSNNFIISVIILSFLTAQFGGNFIHAKPYIEDLIMFYHPPNSSFFNLFTRLWEFFIGVYLSQNEKKLINGYTKSKIFEISSLFLILICTFLFNERTPHPSFLTIPIIIATSILIINNNSKSICKILIDNKLFNKLGEISYSFYLWHLPIIYFFTYKIFGDKFLVILFSFLFTIIFSYLTHELIEKKFRSEKIFTKKHSIFYCVSYSILIFTIFIFPNGFFNKNIKKNKEAKIYFDAINKNDPNAFECRGADVGKFCTYGNKNRINTVVWGDSHMSQQIVTLDRVAKNKNFGFYEITTPGCAPIFYTDRSDKSGQFCNFRNNNIKKFIKKNKIKRIIIHAYWGLYIDDERSKSIRGKKILDELNETILYLIDNNIKVFIITSIPTMKVNIAKEEIRKIITNNGKYKIIKKIKLVDFLKNNSESFNFFNNIDNINVHLIHPYKLLCDSEYCYSKLNNNILYRDDDHLNLDGAEYIEELYLNNIN